MTHETVVTCPMCNEENPGDNLHCAKCNSKLEVVPQMQPTVPISTPKPVSLRWYEVWLKVFTQPSIATFESIINDPHATGKKAYTWVFVSSLIGTVISTVLFLTSSSSSTILLASHPEAVNTTNYAGPGQILCGVIIQPIITMIGFAISIAIIHAVASALGGTGNPTRFTCAVAAYWAPLTIVLSTFTSLMELGAPTQPLFISGIIVLVALLVMSYGFVLCVLAIKAVYQLSWAKAIITPLIVPVITVTCCSGMLILASLQRF